MTDYGIITILPPIIVVVLAVWWKKPVESLLFGSLSAYVIIAYKTHANFWAIAMESFFKVGTQRENLWIIIVCGLFGSLIALLNHSKSSYAIGKKIASLAKNTKSTMVASFALGILLFIDDYMNVLTVSACMNQVCRRRKVPKAALAYIIDSTSAPVCVLVPMSTWTIFYADCFYKQEAIRNLNIGSAISTYMHAVPYMFYATMALLVVFAFVTGWIPAIGDMKKDFQSELKQSQSETKEKQFTEEHGSIWDFIIPIASLVCITAVFNDILLALLLSIIISLLLYWRRGILKVDDFSGIWLKGFADMIPTLAVLFFAFYMKQACTDIYLSEYVLNKCLPFVRANSFPAAAFVLVALITFATGDSWGVPAICIPIVIPLAAACGANILLTMGAIVSGGVFCSHACFYSDTTVLTATCCEMTSIHHAKTQFPYALIAFVVSLIMYAMAGYLI